MTTDLATIDAPAEIREQVAACVAWSDANTIATADQYATTAAHLKAIKTAMKRADEFFDPPIRQVHELHKMLVQRKKVLTDPLAQSERIDKSKMLTYMHEETAKAAAEQRRLQTIADEAARKEREALEKRAATAKKPETQERLREEAAAVVAPVIAVASAAPKVAGISMPKYWTAEIVDMKAFLSYACEAKRFDLLLPNHKCLEALARALKEMAQVPGVKFAEKTGVSGRTA